MALVTVAALAGAGFAAGGWLALAGLLGHPGPVRPHRASWRRLAGWLSGGRSERARARRRAQTLGAGVAAALGWLVTGWPVAAVLGVLAVFGLPFLLRPGAATAAEIDRLEALEEWTRGLANRLVAGSGLEQAVIASSRTAPAPIGAEVGMLAARLRAGWATAPALRAFADQVDSATGDLVAAALIRAATRRGPGLARVLRQLAAAVSEEVTMRRRVEAERARPRTTARLVSLIAVAAFAVMSLNGDYMSPYGTPLGQLVLAAIVASFAAALAWMRALTAGKPEPRLLAPAGPPTKGRKR